jgi:hypothetical protein
MVENKHLIGRFEKLLPLSAKQNYRQENRLRNSRMINVDQKSIKLW